VDETNVSVTANMLRVNSSESIALGSSSSGGAPECVRLTGTVLANAQHGEVSQVGRGATVLLLALLPMLLLMCASR
jgi:hypothetical protein